MRFNENKHGKKKPWPNVTVQEAAALTGRSFNDVCCICLEAIHVQIFRNSGVCCEDHRKDRDDDHEPFKAVGLKVHEGEDK